MSLTLPNYRSVFCGKIRAIYKLPNSAIHATMGAAASSGSPESGRDCDQGHSLPFSGSSLRCHPVDGVFHVATPPFARDLDGNSTRQFPDKFQGHGPVAQTAPTWKLENDHWSLSGNWHVEFSASRRRGPTSPRQQIHCKGAKPVLPFVAPAKDLWQSGLLMAGSRL